MSAVAPKVSQSSSPQADMVWRSASRSIPQISFPRTQAARMVPATPTAAASLTAAIPA